MSGYESRGHFGWQEQFSQPEQPGQQQDPRPGDGQREPDQRRRQYNDEVYPQPGQFPRTNQFPPRAAGPGYRPPDHVATEWLPRPVQFTPYQNPVLRPQPGQYPQPDQGRQPWDLVTREPEQYQARPSAPRLAVPRAQRNFGLRRGEPFWYVLGCVAAGAAYLLKLPAKKAAAEILTELHRAGGGPGEGYGLGGAETFWYVLLCFPLGGAYFAKVSAKKALWEMVTLLEGAPDAYRNALARALYGDQQPR
jgi:hypothetical protein